MAEKDALLAFQHEYGVCANYSYSRGWGGRVQRWSRSRKETNGRMMTMFAEAKYMVEDASSKKFLEELTLVELGGHLRIKESLRVQDSDKLKDNNIFGPSVVNMVEHNNSTRIEKVEKLATRPMVQAQMDDDVAWWVDSRETIHVCKDRCWFKTYELLNNGLILHMENKSTTLVHGRGCVDIRFSSEKIISLFNVLFCYVYLLHTKDEALDKFKVFKTKVELQKGSLIKRFKTDRGGEYMDTLYFQSVGIIHKTTTPYTLQQNGIFERKNRVLKEMVNSMLSYSRLSQGLWGEAMLTAC
ncbi:zinc finger, CCHC-type containing protein [Tanacetum coccineum]|uniref:Zinc finger, CCHC-type containing protein n=1 Tax=Tanacetum coccineum TaxID=301880 RepID=A0ABQ5IXH8_9ASTR